MLLLMRILFIKSQSKTLMISSGKVMNSEIIFKAIECVIKDLKLM